MKKKDKDGIDKSKVKSLIAKWIALFHFPYKNIRWLNLNRIIFLLFFFF